MSFEVPTDRYVLTSISDACEKGDCADAEFVLVGLIESIDTWVHTQLMIRKKTRYQLQ